ncbi:MAG: LamG-like jellyroll fold domain-containing protein, partial [Agriterribacter sp.]
MKKFTKLAGLCLAFLFSIPGIVDAQRVMGRQARTLTTAEGDVFYAYEYTPQGYNPADTTLHPLIIFLHGIGERSNNINSLPSLENLGLPLVIKDGSTMTFNWNGKTESFVVMAPMSRATTTVYSNLNRWRQEYIQATINYALANLKVDPDRIYLTGLSYGGGGTLNYISINSTFTQRIAAAAPVASPDHFEATGPTYVKNANLPVWAFAGQFDDTTSPTISQTVVNEINAVNPPVRARLSIIPNGYHNWVTYNAVYYHLNHPNGVYENPISLYEWFLGQNKSLSANILPVADAGDDQNISISPGTATLDGSNSSDADGIVRYLWKQISGPKTIAITNTYTSSITAAATHKTKNISGLTIAGTYRFELIVVDTRAGISKDTVEIVAGTTSPPSSGKAVTITGSLGKIATGDVTELKNASRFTLEAQFKYNASVSRWTTIMRKSMTSSTPPLSDRIMLHISPDTNAIYVMVGNGSNSYGRTAANAVSPGSWFHVAAVFDGTQTGNANRLKLYINGVQQSLDFNGTTIPNITSGTNSAPFMAGGEPSCCDLNGTIDEVRVWNTALAAGTIGAWRDKSLRSCHPN